VLTHDVLERLTRDPTEPVDAYPYSCHHGPP
jgi:hypothetical protein